MDLDYILGIFPDLMAATLVTLRITFLGMALASTVGLLLAIGRLSPHPAIRLPVTGLVEFVRLTPLLVQLFFVFYVLPLYGVTLDPELTGVLVLGFHYSTFTSEVYRAGIGAVGRGQWEAAAALNMPTGLTWVRVILPQAIPPMIPALGNYLIGMFKDVPTLSIITVYELLSTAKLLASQSFRYVETFTLVGVIFLGISYPAAVMVRRLERRFGSDVGRASAVI
jgi:polar amino acid transport system permease protein